MFCVKTKLCSDLRILNLLFSRPTSWITQVPLPLELNTAIVSNFNITASYCPCEPATITQEPLPVPQMVTTVNGRFIQLLYPYFSYSFEVSRPIIPMRADPQTQKAYPLIDVFGKTLGKTKSFTVGGYTGLVMFLSDYDVKVTTTATFEEVTDVGAFPRSVYSFVGDYVVNVCGKDIVVATRSTAAEGGTLTPSPDFVALSYAVKAQNMKCPISVRYLRQQHLEGCLVLCFVMTLQHARQ